MIIDAIIGAFLSYFKIAIVIIPVLIAIEVARDLDIIRHVSRLMRPFTNRFKIADEGTVLITIGMVFGLTYGAGAIIQSAKDGHLDQKSRVVVGVFLAICHAAIEDSVIFAAMGAHFGLILIIRFVTAVILSYFIAWRLEKAIGISS